MRRPAAGTHSKWGAGRGSELDLDLDASGQIQAHQSLHRLGAGIVDVDQTLVGAALVGRGMGPETVAPVRLAVSTIFSALWSMS